MFGSWNSYRRYHRRYAVLRGAENKENRESWSRVPPSWLEKGVSADWKLVSAPFICFEYRNSLWLSVEIGRNDIAGTPEGEKITIWLLMKSFENLEAGELSPERPVLLANTCTQVWTESNGFRGTFGFMLDLLNSRAPTLKPNDGAAVFGEEKERSTFLPGEAGIKPRVGVTNAIDVILDEPTVHLVWRRTSPSTGGTVFCYHVLILQRTVSAIYRNDFENIGMLMHLTTIGLIVFWRK